MATELAGREGQLSQGYSIAPRPSRMFLTLLQNSLPLHWSSQNSKQKKFYKITVVQTSFTDPVLTMLITKGDSQDQNCTNTLSP